MVLRLSEAEDITLLMMGNSSPLTLPSEAMYHSSLYRSVSIHGLATTGKRTDIAI